MRSKSDEDTSEASIRRPYPDLKTLVFSAKIDFVTVFTPGKLTLPELTGKHNWSPKHNWTRLTVHDPGRLDIIRMIDSLGPLRLAELEVCVDVSCTSAIPLLEQDEHLQRVLVDVFARGLNPPNGRDLTGNFRAAFLYGPMPFNLRLPKPTEQLLFGHKTDAAQVKCYHKKIDQKLALHPEDWVARVEVALRHDALQAHGLITLPALLGFRYRKELSRYFRHVRDVSRRELDRPTLPPFSRLLVSRAQESLKAEFNRVGVGAVKRGGKFADKDIRPHQDSAVNGRIGQALLRLERNLRPEIRAPIGLLNAS